MERPSRYPPEVRERAVRMVLEHRTVPDVRTRPPRRIGANAEHIRRQVWGAAHDTGFQGAIIERILGLCCSRRAHERRNAAKFTPAPAIHGSSV